MVSAQYRCHSEPCIHTTEIFCKLSITKAGCKTKVRFALNEVSINDVQNMGYHMLVTWCHYTEFHVHMKFVASANSVASKEDL